MGIWSVVGSIAKSALGSFLGNAGSSAVSGISTAISNKTQYNYSKQLMALQNKYNSAAAKNSYNYSKKLQEYQNNFTSGLASTAHQVEVNDLRKAGLNPILSVTGGSGASVPGAGNAGISQSGVGLASAPEVDYLGSALAFRQQKNLNEQTDSSVWLNRKQASLVGEQARNEAERYESIVQDRKNSIAVTASQVERNQKEGDAALLNALSNREAASARAYRDRQEGLGASYENVSRKNKSDLYRTKYGRSGQQSTEILKNVPFIGRYLIR